MRMKNRTAGLLAAAMAAGGALAPAMAAGEFLWPVSGSLTSTHVYSNGAWHSGSADIAAGFWTPFGASRGGNAYAFWEGGGCGNGLWVNHAAGYRTIYCHQVRWALAGGGAWVNANQTVGYVGSTGNSTGPHLHLGIIRYGVRLIIPSIWIGKWVGRGSWIPGTWSGLTSGGSTSSVLFRAKVVSGDGVNVRTGPGTGYARVGGLYYGNIVNVYGTSGSWYKIIYAGYYRWIAGWYTVRV